MRSSLSSSEFLQFLKCRSNKNCMRIVITGSIAYDYLMVFPGRFRDHILPDKLDSLALSFLVDTMTKQRGGVAPNIAHSLPLLGGQPAVLATAGQDFPEYRTCLESPAIA